MKRRMFSIILPITFILFGCGSGARSESTMVLTETVETREAQTIIEETEKTIERTEEEENSIEEENNREESMSHEKAESEQPVKESIVVNMASTPAATTEPTPASTPEPIPAPHTCTWDEGTVTVNATCDSAGVKTLKCTGCGNTRTESTGDAVKGHIAGEHTYWPSGPTCLGAANYNVYCTVCGKHLESGTDPALPHTEVATVMQQGNCSVLTQISYDCEVCGSHLRSESYYEDEHEWITGEGEIFNTVTLEWEKVSTTYCSLCGGGMFSEKD